MTIAESVTLLESMDLSPIRKEKMTFNDGKESEVWNSVLDDEDDSHKFNLANANMRSMLSALGRDGSEEEFLIPIDQFINLATHWLRKHINKP